MDINYNEKKTPYAKRDAKKWQDDHSDVRVDRQGDAACWDCGSYKFCVPAMVFTCKDCWDKHDLDVISCVTMEYGGYCALHGEYVYTDHKIYTLNVNQCSDCMRKMGRKTNENMKRDKKTGLFLQKWIKKLQHSQGKDWAEISGYQPEIIHNKVDGTDKSNMYRFNYYADPKIKYLLPAPNQWDIILRKRGYHVPHRV